MDSQNKTNSGKLWIHVNKNNSVKTKDSCEKTNSENYGIY